MAIPSPGMANDFLAEHAVLLIRSYRLWTGRDLIDPALSPGDAARALYQAPLVVLSHDTAADPVFTYANETAQNLFEMSWEEIVGMPSRYSAEPVARADRESFLAQVATHGYIENYSGIRIARSGRRFRVRNATVWNLLENEGRYRGQAACFSDWEPIGGHSP
jgi:hypothetical protein